MAECDRRPVHQIARLDRHTRIVGGHPRTEFLHPADAFMAEDNREGHNPGAAIGDMDIAAAHAADDNPHQRAAGLGIADRPVPGLAAVGLDEYDCLRSGARLGGKDWFSMFKFWWSPLH